MKKGLSSFVAFYEMEGKSIIPDTRTVWWRHTPIPCWARKRWKGFAWCACATLGARAVAKNGWVDGKMMLRRVLHDQLVGWKKFSHVKYRTPKKNPKQLEFRFRLNAPGMESESQSGRGIGRGLQSRWHFLDGMGGVTSDGRNRWNRWEASAGLSVSLQGVLCLSQGRRETWQGAVGRCQIVELTNTAKMTCMARWLVESFQVWNLCVESSA